MQGQRFISRSAIQRRTWAGVLIFRPTGSPPGPVITCSITPRALSAASMQASQTAGFGHMAWADAAGVF
ncbi:MAG: hypothetical protein ACYCXF_04190 [Thermoleophilia bacterium]